MSQRKAIVGALAVLTIMLAVLIYLYLTLIRPPQLTQRADPQAGIRHVFTIYGYGDKAEELFDKPHGVAVDNEGNVYVTDTNNHRVLVFDERGRFIKKIGKAGSGEGELRHPLGIDVADNGDIYVVSRELNKVVVLDRRGKLKREMEAANPLQVRVLEDEVLVVTASEVLFYDLKGKGLRRWGSLGSAEGEIDFPGGLYVDSKGVVYVSDSNNKRIQAFNKKNGELLWASDKQVSFGLPESIVGDEEGRLFVMDAFHMTIKVLRAKDGKKLVELGDQGQADGEFYYPSGLDYAGDGFFYVADKFNHRVQKVRITPPALR
ncbi:MAG: 6-bladed beta-propeller [Terriglobia bacterium]